MRGSHAHHVTYLPLFFFLFASIESGRVLLFEVLQGWCFCSTFCRLRAPHTQREMEGWREANRKYESTLPQNYFVCIKKLKAKSANKAALTKVRQPRMHRLCCRTCVVRFTFISILSGKNCILHRWKLPQAQLDSFVQTFRYQKQSEEIKSVNIGCKKKNIKQNSHVWKMRYIEEWIMDIGVDFEVDFSLLPYEHWTGTLYLRSNRTLFLWFLSSIVCVVCWHKWIMWLRSFSMLSRTNRLCFAYTSLNFTDTQLEKMEGKNCIVCQNA